MELKGRERRVALGGKTSFVWGQRTFDVLSTYLAELEWPEEGAQGGAAGVTWLELAIDYEVSTGHNIPKVVTAHGSEAQRAAAADVARQVARERALHDRDHGCARICSVCECAEGSGVRRLARR